MKDILKRPYTRCFIPDIDSLRGHPMHFDESIQEWRYKDDDTLVAEGWKDRPCGKCGEPFTPEGHDPCLGTLPGVMNACCGHGEEREAYVQFSKRVRVGGKAAAVVMRALRGLRMMYRKPICTSSQPCRAEVGKNTGLNP